MLTNINNIEFAPGSINILSVWPCMGKTTAAATFRGFPNVNIIDLDSHDVRVKMKDGDDFVETYVHTIREIVSGLNASADHKRIDIILISSHPEVVRKLTNANDPKVICVAPHFSGLKTYINMAEGRAKSNPSEGNLNALKFMEEKAETVAKETWEAATDIGTPLTVFLGVANGSPYWLTGLITAGIINGGVADDMRDDIIWQMGKMGVSVDENAVEAFVDAAGHMVIRTKDTIKGKKIMRDYANRYIGVKHNFGLAFRGTDSIILAKTDAMNLLAILDKTLSDAGEDVRDIDLFGPAAISYERLYDRTVNESYMEPFQNQG